MSKLAAVPANATGTYLITTVSGSRYLTNYDRMTLTRIRSSTHSNTSTLRRDGEEIDILSIGSCVVGERLLLVVNLRVPGAEFTIRPTTQVVSIEPIDWDPLTGGPT